MLVPKLSLLARNPPIQNRHVVITIIKKAYPTITPYLGRIIVVQRAPVVLEPTKDGAFACARAMRLVDLRTDALAVVEAGTVVRDVAVRAGVAWDTVAAAGRAATVQEVRLGEVGDSIVVVESLAVANEAVIEVIVATRGALGTKCGGS